MAKCAFIFPGQGAQHVGMGKDLCEAFPAAKDLFTQAEDVTSLPISKYCFEGPEETLSRTDIAQPAIYTMSAAMLDCMRDALAENAKVPRAEVFEALQVSYYAGLSLGEYTALYAAGMIDFADALRLVAKRGAAMQAAAEASDSTMVALIGVDEEQANALCDAVADGQVLTPANFNCPGQVVISGETAACKRAIERAEEFGARGATELNVAGAFHSELMAPAAAELSEAIAEVRIRSAEGKTVLANVNAKPYGGPEDVAKNLQSQLTGAVRWQQCCQAMLADGVDTFYEIGPGKVLAGLMRRIDRKAKVVVLNSKDALEKALAELLA